MVKILYSLIFPTVVLAGTTFGQSLPSGNIASSRAAERAAENERRLDPGRTGWDTEVFSSEAEAQLSRLAKWMKDHGERETRLLETLLAAEFRADRLRPEDLTTVFDDGVTTVRRGSGAVSAASEDISPTDKATPSTGITRFTELLGAFGAGGPRKVKFKLFRVRMGGAGETTSTRQYVEMSGPSEDGTREWNAVWTIHWTVEENISNPPRIRAIEVDTFEEVDVRSIAPGSTFLADCTTSIFRGVDSFAEQLSRGTDYWLQRMERRYQLYYFGHQGMSLGDINGDGLEDLYVCQPGGLPNRLYVQNGDGSLRDVSAEAGVDLLDYTRSSLFIDIDNDGDQDLVASTLHHLLMFANDGSGRFQLRVAEAGADAALSLAAADYDRDGDLDLYVCRYYDTHSQEGEFAVPLPFHDAENGAGNRLLRNEGNWEFTDATEEAGLDAHNTRFTFSAAWEDYDNDGDLDLYVANDFGRNNLYRNDNGAFTDVAGDAGVEDIAPGMSVTWGDYNRDGHSDLYVSNMFSAAGNRITFQDRFQPRLDTTDRALFQRHAQGNSLFLNRGDGTFSDTSIASGTTMGRWAWGSLFADLNNDGWDDLLTCNGFITGERLDDL